MKIQHLKIHNIASIGDASIDFENGALAVDPIFLITGNTGSGKTTVLNAICLALFDKVPSLQDSNMKDADYEGQSNNKSIQLMRKGTGYAEVVLKFKGNDGKNYTVTWTAQRQHKNPNKPITINSPSRILSVEGKNTTWQGVKEINAKIQEVMGLTFDQFTRTTMLAQGQFASFIKATPEDKAKILEKLTGTEIYAEIGKKVYELYKEKEVEYTTLQRELQRYVPLTPEQREAMSNRLHEVSASLDALKIQAEKIGALLTWMQQDSAHETLLKQKRQVLDTANAAINSETYRQQQLDITHWDETAALRRLLDDIESSRLVCRRMEQELSNLTDESLHHLLDGICHLEYTHIVFTNSLSEISSSLSELEPISHILDSSTEISQSAKDIKRSVDSVKDHDAKAKKYVQESQQSANKEKVIAEEYDKVSALHTNQAKQVQLIEVQCKGIDLKKLTSDRDDIDHKIRHLQMAAEAINKYRQCLTEHNEAQAACNEIDTELNNLQKQYEEAQAKLPDAIKALKHWQNLLRGYTELNDHIESLRQRFAETQICPLCGTEHVHIHPDSQIDKALQDIQRSEKQANDYLNLIQQQIDSANASINTLKPNKTRADRTLKNKEAALNAAFEAANSLMPDFTDDAEVIEHINQSISEATAMRDALSSQIITATERQNGLVAAQREINALTDRKAKVHTDLQRQQNTTENLKQSAKSEQDEAQKAADEANQFLSTAVNIIGNNFDGLCRILKLELESKEIKLENISLIADKIQQLALNRENLKKQCDSTRQDIERLNLQIANCNNSIQGLAQKFASDYTPEPIKLDNIDVCCAELSREINTTIGQIKVSQQVLSGHQEKLERMLADSAYSLDDIHALKARLSDELIKDMRTFVTNLQTELQNAQVEHALIEKQIADHRKVRPDIPEGATIESISQQKADNETARENALTEKSNIEHALNDDENLKKQLAESQRKLEQLRIERNNWEKLNKKYGAQDGHLFRTIAQSYVLRILLSQANYFLRMLSSRYLLYCEDGSLTIYVKDMDLNDVVRNVGILSGGESFIVSLALALGLSTLGVGDISVDPIFIDEGFGTLDDVTLETVIRTLEQLHQNHGRHIGIISHVPELKERITTQLQILPVSKSTSTIKVVTL